MSRHKLTERAMAGRDEGGASVIELVIAIPIFIMLMAALLDGAMMVVTKMQANDGATAAAREAMAEAGTEEGLDEGKIKAAALSAMPGIEADQVSITLATSNNDEDFYYHMPDNAELPDGATVTETGTAYNGEELALGVTKTGQRVSVGVTVSRPWITALGKMLYGASTGSGDSGSYTPTNPNATYQGKTWDECKAMIEAYGAEPTGSADADAANMAKTSTLCNKSLPYALSACTESGKMTQDEADEAYEEVLGDGTAIDMDRLKELFKQITGSDYTDADTANRELLLYAAKAGVLDKLASEKKIPGYDLGTTWSDMTWAQMRSKLESTAGVTLTGDAEADAKAVYTSYAFQYDMDIAAGCASNLGYIDDDTYNVLYELDMGLYHDGGPLNRANLIKVFETCTGERYADDETAAEQVQRLDIKDDFNGKDIGTDEFEAEVKEALDDAYNFAIDDLADDLGIDLEGYYDFEEYDAAENKAAITNALKEAYAAFGAEQGETDPAAERYEANAEAACAYLCNETYSDLRDDLKKMYSAFGTGTAAADARDGYTICQGAVAEADAGLK